MLMYFEAYEVREIEGSPLKSGLETLQSTLLDLRGYAHSDISLRQEMNQVI
jgi:hypothetical protein